jgi:spore coat polysaccharide biosynthesis protein SpsF (cytidylyltransferase family)
MSNVIRVFIEARMDSARFPGKALAPFRGRPIIASVIERVTQAIPPSRVTVATSDQRSDDPLSCYVRDLGISVHRGPLDNQFVRFRSCLERFTCRWFFRLSADSPLVNSAVLRTMTTYADREDIDLVTNLSPRTFPKGHCAEMLLSETFARIDPSRLSAEEKEEATRIYYNNPTEFRIINVQSGNPKLAIESLCIDAIEDLHRLEKQA